MRHMPATRHYASDTGPYARRGRSGKVYHGSRKRVRQIKWRDSTPLGFWMFVILMLLLLLVGIPWLIQHPAEEHHRTNGAPLMSRLVATGSGQ